MGAEEECLFGCIMCLARCSERTIRTSRYEDSFNAVMVVMLYDL